MIIREENCKIIIFSSFLPLYFYMQMLTRLNAATLTFCARREDKIAVIGEQFKVSDVFIFFKNMCLLLREHVFLSG